MNERTRHRNRSKSISISYDLWDKIKMVCDENISVSGFIKMAVKKELRRRGVG